MFELLWGGQLYSIYKRFISQFWSGFDRRNVQLFQLIFHSSNTVTITILPLCYPKMEFLKNLNPDFAFLDPNFLTSGKFFDSFESFGVDPKMLADGKIAPTFFP